MCTKPRGKRTREISVEGAYGTSDLLDEEITGGWSIRWREYPPWKDAGFLLPWEDGSHL